MSSATAIEPTAKPIVFCFDNRSRKRNTAKTARSRGIGLQLPLQIIRVVGQVGNLAACQRPFAGGGIDLGRGDADLLMNRLDLQHDSYMSGA